MWKYIGFIGVVIVFVVILRPDLFFGSKDVAETPPVEENSTVTRKSNDKEYTDPRRPTLIKKDANLPSEHTAYADGYGEEDFGAAFKEPEEMFAIKGQEIKSPGGLWDILLSLRFDISYDPSTDMVVQLPMFKAEHKKLQNQIIEIEGYIVPFDIVHDMTGNSGDGTMFMLSAFPAATCFFCKGAGPESVIEVYPKKPIPYTKNLVKIRGRLELNDVDYLKMAYLLRDSESAK
jgi:hypothetical protein